MAQGTRPPQGMILAAGAGTRLRPLTDRTPKALVEVGGRPMLAWVMERMSKAGVRRLVVNTHHHGDQIREFLEGVAGGAGGEIHGVAATDPGGEDDPGPGGPTEFQHLDVAVSSEPQGPLGTGGGLFKAAPLFTGDAPIILHNVDVISEIDLDGLVARHRAAVGSRMKGQKDATTDPGLSVADPPAPDANVIATLAVQDRGSTRTLLFDDLGLLGWENRGCDHARDGRVQVRDSVGQIRGISFAGIHVLGPGIFGLSERTGTFSIITLYLELARAGWIIQPVDVTGQPWFDIGTAEKLDVARSWIKERTRSP